VEEIAMSAPLMTDAESFYQFLGQSLSTGSRETPPEALLRTWRERREYEETCEDIRQGIADMEAGLGKPIQQVADEIRAELGFKR
jgi:hypothetical protein